MPRAKFQVLVIPYVIQDKQIKYCTFLREDMNIWQFIAGGGEDDETPIEAAKREANEEADIAYTTSYYMLDTCCSIPVECFNEVDRQRWGENCFVIPEYSFAVDVNVTDLKLSHEHVQYKWLDYKSAKKLLKYDSNKIALGELNTRIKKGLLGEKK
ncbi:NUDIX domain-containing protein [Tissierella pigra]|uniref:NUDIX domain-containing protein n=1 Tax=Tissierella pigra TaxID=2607614 RepID=A0A6N7Y2Z6_9FIRM|nr:NUDIX domain-containing protein [Tissierella pigra]MBU5426845.1 NUDIX domain-containing protein [Tissierella pigra]MSU03244.1 NUDIX domain-containing protein [Tissierella pigra]